MSEISNEAKLKACELAGQDLNWSEYVGPFEEAFARYIQQASDAAKLVVGNNGDAYCMNGNTVSTELRPFILADPVDPIIAATGEAFGEIWDSNEYGTKEQWAEAMMAQLAKRGLKIVESGQ